MLIKIQSKPLMNVMANYSKKEMISSRKMPNNN